MPLARLHLITPDPVDATVLSRLGLALAAGAPWVQVRAKSGTDAERFAAVRAAAERCARAGATCVVNDRLDLALAAGAHGVHLGLDDLPVAAARRVVPAGFVLGATVRHPDQARQAAAAGATYLGVGPVYRTTTKAGLPEPIGWHGLAAVAQAVDVPVIAISGVTPERVPEVLAAGAHGVAVVAAVFGAADVGGETGRFLAALAAGTGGPGRAGALVGGEPEAAVADAGNGSR